PYPANTFNTDKWGGCMTYAPGLNIPATNTDAIEMWIKVESIDNADLSTAKLRFDIGRMSEDVIPNGRLDMEDRNLSGRYDPGEDVGLDGLDDAGERAKFDTIGPPFDANDPNNDNYGTDIEHNDGLEGNSTDAQSGLKPNTEDLDGNGSVNVDNA